MKQKEEDLSKSLKEIDEMKFQMSQKEKEMKRQHDLKLVGDGNKQKENEKKEKFIAVTDKDVIMRKAQLKKFLDSYRKLEKDFKQKEGDLSKSLKEIDEMKFQMNQKEEEMKRQHDFKLVELEKYYIIMKTISSFLLFSMETGCIHVQSYETDVGMPLQYRNLYMSQRLTV